MYHPTNYDASYISFPFNSFHSSLIQSFSQWSTLFIHLPVNSFEFQNSCDYNDVKLIILIWIVSFAASCFTTEGIAVYKTVTTACGCSKWIISIGFCNLYNGRKHGRLSKLCCLTKTDLDDVWVSDEICLWEFVQVRYVVYTYHISPFSRI